jgi:hypothetical protein
MELINAGPVPPGLEELGPPPETGNPLDDLAWMKKALGQLTRKIDELADLEGRRLYSIKDLAELLGMSGSAIRQAPWRRPNFGKPDVEGPARWWGRTVMAWYREPEADRRRRWDMMGMVDRRRAMGISS